MHRCPHDNHAVTNMQMLQCLVFAAALLLSAGDEIPCPTGCTCLPQDMQSALSTVCTASSAYDAIPSEFPTNSQSLRLENYHLLKLPELKTSLPNLHSLSINHCHLDSLEGLDFSMMPNLVHLDIRHNHMEKVPSLDGTKIEVLHLGYNRIEVLNMSNFGSVPTLKELYVDHNLVDTINISTIFQNLEKLVLHNNNITDMKEALTNLTYLPKLNALNLANNSLTKLEGFPKMNFLQYLDVSNNSLLEIQDNTFLNLTSLVTLNLQRNRLLNVPHGLPMLENLDLSHNQIIHILEVQKPDLYPVEVFNFAHNPLHCDCHMLWLKELYDQREYLLKHIPIPPKEFIPRCASPSNLVGESWDQLGDSLFTCETSTKVKGGKPDLVIKSGKVTGDSIEVYWSWTVKGPLAYSTVYIQYYVFGLRSETKRYIQVALAQRQYTLKNLRPNTNYLICVIPKEDDQAHSEIPQPQSLDYCLEILTKDGEPIQVLSLFYIVLYYFLGMSATVIGVFAMIGLIALLYGAYSSKSDWSAKYVPVDEPVDEHDDTHVSERSEEGSDNKESQAKKTDNDNKEHKD